MILAAPRRSWVWRGAAFERTLHCLRRLKYFRAARLRFAALIPSLLILGGTRFLGRHLAQTALDLGFAVTLFTRGRGDNPFGSRVTHCVGDRDPRVAPGLAALAEGTWDIVVDCSGYVPRIVAASVELLADRCARYVFVSSISVYADLSVPGVSESAPLIALPDAKTEDVAAHYGALKAASEAVVVTRLGSRALIVRPGLIVGPYDPTDRFTYWAARFAVPGQLGRRGDDVVMFGPPTRPIQCIDARDAADWILDAAQRALHGPYNLASLPNQWTCADLARAGETVARAYGLDTVVRWALDADLLAHDVVPWSGLGLWLPDTEAAFLGMLTVDTGHAARAGLTTRALADSLGDTARWLKESGSDGRWAGVMDGVCESRIAAELSARPPLV